jgi:hypothetical protein
MKKRRKAMKPTFYKFVVFILSAFLCFGVSACGSSIELSDDPVEAAAQKAFGKNYDSKEKSYYDFEYNFKIVYEDLDDFDSFEDTVKKDTFKALKNLADDTENEDYSFVNFDYYYSYTDEYGKETATNIISSRFDDYDINRVDYNNAKYQTIDEISESWFERQDLWPEYE